MNDLNADAVMSALEAYHASLPTHEFPSRWAMEEAIRAYLTLSAAAGVKPRVKPLEWVDCGGGDAYAFTVCGTYTIQNYHSYATIQLPGQKLRDREKWASINEAKAAAQADYEARIMSALTTEGE